jgi:hypothetical protein
MEYFIIYFFLPLLVNIIGGLILSKYFNSPRLNYYLTTGYTTAFPAKESPPGTIVYTQLMKSLTLVNSGKTSLKNVQVLHSIDISYNQDKQLGNSRIVALGITPNIPHKFSKDGKALIFESFPPKEAVTIHYTYPVSIDPTITNTIHQLYSSGKLIIRSDEALGEPLKLVKQTIFFPKWVQIITWALLAIGVWVSTSFLATLVLWIAKHKLGLWYHMF